MAAEWYYRIKGTEFGPFSSPDIIRLVADGTVTTKTEVRKGDDPWIPASRVPSLFNRAARLTAAKPISRPPAADDASMLAPSSAALTGSARSAGNYEILDVAEAGGFKVEILAFPRLAGA